MYKRYEPMPHSDRQTQNRQPPPKTDVNPKSRMSESRPVQNQRNGGYGGNSGGARQKAQNHTGENGSRRKPHPITKFIPQSIYNPETGRVLGIFSAEDLLIAALILLLIDSSTDEGEDNSLLIYALIYLLISEHIDLPF